MVDIKVHPFDTTTDEIDSFKVLNFLSYFHRFSNYSMTKKKSQAISPVRSPRLL